MTMTDGQHLTRLRALWVAAEDESTAASAAYVQAIASPYRTGVEVTALMDEWLMARTRAARALEAYVLAGGEVDG